MARALFYVTLKGLAMLATLANPMVVARNATLTPNVELVLLNAEQTCLVQLATLANPMAVVLNAMPIPRPNVDRASLHVELMNLALLATPADPMAAAHNASRTEFCEHLPIYAGVRNIINPICPEEIG